MSKSKSFFEIAKQKIKDQVSEFFDQNKDEIKTTAKKIVDDGIKSFQDAAINKADNFMNSKNNIKDITSSSSNNHVQKNKEQVEVKAENDFDNQVRKDLVGTVKSIAAGNPAEAAQVLKRFIEVAGDVAKFTEQQKTVRKDIEAKRDSDIARIQAQKEIIMIYLEKSFDERKENFSKLFQVIDHAIANNNMQQLAMGLDSINQLAASSPFKALATLESTKEAINDKNHIWDF
ncbi:MAG TPA: hypothetical protein H9887_03965 [Candidatus Dorea intestinavium]|uniref:hypothetical protein n=1 Tax=Acinetobacter towneri TaxID=202956 RepID=UPI001F864F7E|nr:hypothetical protein [Candidatus Dorea intestinavium]